MTRAASAAQPSPAKIGPRSIRVVKLGGSLLGCADLPRLWRNWRAAQPPASDVLIAGGGAFADAIRLADETHQLGDQAAHVLAIQSLSLTARLLANLLPEARWAGRLTDAVLNNSESPATPIVLDLGACWQDPNSQPALATLPASWYVTSDSLAAAVAHSLTAFELVLLKSAAPPTADLAALAAAGYVDAYFPQAAAGLTVRLVNLRSVAFP